MILKTGVYEGVWMISDVLANRILVCQLKESEASNLVEILFLLLHHNTHVRTAEPVSREKLPQVIIAESLEWTSVVLTLSRWLLVDDLVAVPWFVVVSLSLLAKHMSDVVCIVFLEFVSVHLLSELTLPELHRFFHSEAQALQEQTKLKTSKML